MKLIVMSSIQKEDIECLKESFAWLTEAGWVIPAWLELLAKVADSNGVFVDNILGADKNVQPKGL